MSVGESVPEESVPEESVPEESVPEDMNRPVDHIWDADVVPAEILNMSASRRDFLRDSLGLALSGGVFASAAGLGAKWASAGADAKLGTVSGSHDYFFDFSHHETEKYDYYLISPAGKTKLEAFSVDGLLAARQQFPHLETIGSSQITHAGSFVLSTTQHALMMIQRVLAGDPEPDNQVVPVGIFYHFPDQVVQAAHNRLQAQYGDQLPSDPIGAQRLIDSRPTAAALTSVHPELLSADPVTAAVVQGHIQQTDSHAALAEHVQNDPNYIVTETLKDEDGNDITFDLSGGEGPVIPLTQWTIPSATAALLVPAAADALTSVKDDASLGEDITNIDPTSEADTTSLTPSLWFTRDAPGPEVQAGAPGTADQVGRNFITKDLTSAYPGLTIKVISNKDDGDHTVVTVELTNHYNRYLAIYARFYDPDGNPVDYPNYRSTSDMVNAIHDGIAAVSGSGGFFAFPTADYYYPVGVSSPGFMAFGQPLTAPTQTIEIHVPLTASDVRIFSGGLGRAEVPGQEIRNTEIDLITLYGTSMTYGFCMVVPPLFLAAQVATQLSPFLKEITSNKTFQALVGTAVVAKNILPAATGSDGLTDWIKFGEEMLKVIMTNKQVWLKIVEYFTIGYIEDEIPFVGVAVGLLAAIDVEDNIIALDSEIDKSPQVYQTDVKLTHDVEVQWDNSNALGARLWALTLDTDGGATIVQELDNNSVEGGVSRTVFRNVPRGSGSFKVTLGAYKGASFQEALARKQLVAQAEFSGKNRNTNEPLRVTSKEFEVVQVERPLNSTTTYRVEAFTVTSTKNLTPPAQQLVWEPVSPGQTYDPGVLGFDDRIVELGGMTINSITGDIGRAWTATNDSVFQCGTRGDGLGTELSLFGNSSTRWNSNQLVDDPNAMTRYFRTEDIISTPIFDPIFPEKHYPACGFARSTQVAYDSFAGDTGRNYYLDPAADYAVRQIRLGVIDGISKVGRFEFDSPTSNLAVGRFNFESDALILHPSGALLSLSRDKHVIEILTPLTQPTSDDNVPRARLLSGRGSRPGRVNGPTRLAVTTEGMLVIAEQENARVSALDLAGNPAPIFNPQGSSKPQNHFELATSDVKFDKKRTKILDLAVENGGHIYVLMSDSSNNSPSPVTGHYINIYRPDGSFLVRLTDTWARRIAVDRWRVMFAMSGVGVAPSERPWALTEPSILLATPNTVTDDPDPEDPAPEDPDPEVVDPVDPPILPVVG